MILFLAISRYFFKFFFKFMQNRHTKDYSHQFSKRNSDSKCHSCTVYERVAFKPTPLVLDYLFNVWYEQSVGSKINDRARLSIIQPKHMYIYQFVFTFAERRGTISRQSKIYFQHLGWFGSFFTMEHNDI